MTERTLFLPRDGKSMEVFVAAPNDTERHTLVLMYMDMWGMREVLRDQARRVAAAGYCCVLPDLYYRGGNVRYAERDEARPGKAFADISPERQAMLQQAMAGLSDAMVLEDTRALLEFLDGNSWTRPGPIGIIGYCMGGRHVLCVAGRYPQRVRAAACIHGAYLIAAGADSPHLIAKHAQGEIYFGHAELDKYAPAKVVQTVDAALDDGGVKYCSVVHKGAQHAYAIPDRDVYDTAAADRDWEAIFAMLRRQLSP
jgi:carboxymethylenebutenolidase